MTCEGFLADVGSVFNRTFIWDSVENRTYVDVR